MQDRRGEIADSMRQRILSGLHFGRLRPGERLPSMRAVAGEFGVAPRTVMSAFRLLEAEGLIELRERSGIFVAPGGGGVETTILPQLAGWVVDMLLEGRAREIAPLDLPERVRRCLETLRLRSVCVAGNADQAEQICHELQHDYGLESESLEAGRLLSPDAEAQRVLTQADLLVSTALHVREVQQVARGLGKPAITVSLRPELMTELTRQIAAGPLYLIGSDPRFRDAVRTIFGPADEAGNLHVPIVGEDDLATLPLHAPIYIMRRAHRLLGDTDFTRRVIPIRRVFSREMARELLTFIVRANISATAAHAA